MGEGMYGRPALGALLPLAGAMGMPAAIPGIPLAKALQATAGAGFLFYCLTAFIIILARACMRRRTPRESLRVPAKIGHTRREQP
ncbi:hypothetical protein OK074_3928 [Actinobacteria bacterium OK074]|nr:hypothetical protein OK074_3928 [Actinobacteria bacterium OK074]